MPGYACGFGEQLEAQDLDLGLQLAIVNFVPAIRVGGNDDHRLTNVLRNVKFFLPQPSDNRKLIVN